jgi:hypothetical protein
MNIQKLFFQPLFDATNYVQNHKTPLVTACALAILFRNINNKIDGYVFQTFNPPNFIKFNRNSKYLLMLTFCWIGINYCTPLINTDAQNKPQGPTTSSTDNQKIFFNATYNFIVLHMKNTLTGSVVSTFPNHLNEVSKLEDFPRIFFYYFFATLPMELTTAIAFHYFQVSITTPLSISLGCLQWFNIDPIGQISSFAQNFFNKTN